MSQAHPYQAEFDRLKRDYAALIVEKGDVPAAAQWADRATQERRFEILAEVGDLTTASVLDYGCGTAHLLDWLQRDGYVGRYTGYDLVPELIEVARTKHPDASLEARDVLRSGVETDHDYVLVSGVFNNRTEDPFGLLSTTLRRLFERTKVALAFNAMSRYVDFLDPKLSYFAPEEVFAFCKTELSPCVSLRHDYAVRPGVLPYEFAVYVYRTEIEPRPLLPVS